MAWLSRCALPAKALQTQQPEPGKLLEAHPVIMMVAEAFEFHAAQAPPNPLVQPPQEPPVSGPARSKVVACASNDSVEFLDELRVQVARTNSHYPNFVSKFLLGLGAHTPRPT